MLSNVELAPNHDGAAKCGSSPSKKLTTSPTSDSSASVITTSPLHRTDGRLQRPQIDTDRADRQHPGIGNCRDPEHRNVHNASNTPRPLPRSSRRLPLIHDRHTASVHDPAPIVFRKNAKSASVDNK